MYYVEHISIEMHNTKSIHIIKRGIMKYISIYKSTMICASIVLKSNIIEKKLHNTV